MIRFGIRAIMRWRLIWVFLFSEDIRMDRVKMDQNGGYHWSCPVDADYHRQSGRKAFWYILLLCAFVFIVFLIASRGTIAREDYWIPLLVAGVILAVALPLLCLWNSAGDPHEQYELTDDYVRSGYGKSSIYSKFEKTKEVIVTEKYIEMIGSYGSNRIYIPPEDMEVIREFILERLPEDVRVQSGQPHQ